MKRHGVAALSLALVLAALLAGCAGGGRASAPSASSSSAEPGGPAAQLPLPAWALRDYWTYSLGNDTASYVVTADQGGDWFVDTDNAERAFQNARDDVSRLGPQRKSDLAGSQGDTRVEFFHWPLADNLTWTTQWDHLPVTITARLPGDGLAHLEARLANGTLDYRYTYDPKVGWFRTLTHYNLDGSEAIALRLTTSGHNWSGNVVRWDLVNITNLAGDMAGGVQEQGTFDVPLTATDVWVHAALHCTSGFLNEGASPFPFFAAAVGADPRGGGAGFQPCPLSSDFSGSAGAPKAPAQGGTAETWGWQVASAPQGVGTYQLEVLVRTQHIIAVPS